VEEIMTLICPRCHLQLRVLKTGTICELMATFGGYQIFAGDTLACSECGMEVVRLANTPITEHYRSDYSETVADLKPTVTFWATEREKAQYIGTEGAL
jgi:hypothetical protein